MAHFDSAIANGDEEKEGLCHLLKRKEKLRGRSTAQANLAHENRQQQMKERLVDVDDWSK